MELEIKKRPRQVDLHFYVAPEYAEFINKRAEETGHSRGRILEALIDLYQKQADK